MLIEMHQQESGGELALCFKHRSACRIQREDHWNLWGTLNTKLISLLGLFYLWSVHHNMKLLNSFLKEWNQCCTKSCFFCLLLFKIGNSNLSAFLCALYLLYYLFTFFHVLYHLTQVVFTVIHKIRDSWLNVRFRTNKK